MPSYLLGIDIGTSACKAAVFDARGSVAAGGAGAYPTYYPQSGWAEQRPDEWWAAVCRTVKGLLEAGNIDPADVKAVGIDGQSWSAIAVDRAGEVLFENPIWMDTRAASICEDIRRDIGEQAVFDICGNPLEPTYTTPKILWYKQNYGAQYRRIYKILQSNSYIIYKLTGRFSQDLSQGNGLHFFDIRRGCWNAELAAALGIDLGLMPDIYRCDQLVGGVTPEAAALCGLVAGTPVVAGGLDAACGTLGSGVAEDGQTQEQGGQSGGMSICTGECRTHPKLIVSCHVAAGTWLLQGGTVGGGGALRWLREKILPDLTFQEMDKLAATAGAGSDGVIFLPYMMGERSPIWDRNARAVYFGLDYAKDKASLIRATMEGVAYSLLHNLETGEEAGARISALKATGGSANSDVWMQIKADVTGRVMEAPESDAATTLGAALLAGIAVGMYTDARDAVRQTVKISRRYFPDAERHERYGKYYGIYLELYEKLKWTMEKLREIG